jgi:ElaB/YqjD/DUF883 family membrane-anchored ribosome-binding protein
MARFGANGYYLSERSPTMATTPTSVNPATNGNKTSKDITVEDLSTQIAVLKDDIASLTSTLGEYGRSKTSEVSRNARNTVNDLSSAGRERALDAQRQAEEFVRTQPTTALGIAAGIGFLVGVITARR